MKMSIDPGTGRGGALALLLAALVLLAGATQAQPVPVHDIEVVERHPHDDQAFTQGLTVHDGRLYEGTGRYGRSSLREVDLESGEILRRRNLDAEYFGEGITILDGRVYQLSWRSHTAFIYDLDDFQLLGTFFLPGEGWGLTDDGEHLIVSDGTAWLRFLDPDTQREVRRVEVRDPSGPVDRLNELEYIDGEVWANIWYEDYLVRIDPASGEVTGRVDLSGLAGPRDAEAVLNGIAWDETDERLFVTGKLWPALYEIRVLPARQAP